MKNLFCLPLLLFFFLLLTQKTMAQYGGYTTNGSTSYLGAGSNQAVFSNITYNDGSITSHPSAIVHFVGSIPNTQHQILANLGSTVATQIGNAVLNNGTGGLLINNPATGLTIITDFNFNAQNAQVTTLRNASAVSTNNLTINANAILTGFNNTNNVNGYLKKQGDAAAFTFPLSDGTNYAPMTVGSIGVGNAVIAAYYKVSASTAAAFQGGPFPVSSVTAPLMSVSSVEYWDVATTGTPTAALSLTFRGNYSVATLPTFFIAGWNIAAAKWEQIPSGLATGLTPGNTISSTGSVNFANYSAFTVSTTTIVLPVTLTDFNAIKINNTTASISWNTATESNLYNYIVERSADGFSGWVAVGEKKPTNTPSKSNYQLPDTAPLIGNNYYRLKIVTVDGTVTYSAVRLVLFNYSVLSVLLYPNPAIHTITMKITGNSDKKYTASLVSSSGQLLQQKTNITTGTEYIFNIEDNVSGVYYLSVWDQTNTILDIKKIVKQ
jgi:hypothetical protein